jgi:endonuclease/exonuclease/phosphatase family metal-dependent hydrolase
MMRVPQIVVSILSWNLFHGLNDRPDPRLRTWPSRLVPMTRTGGAHAHVNRSLREEFAALLAGWPWEVALLQEAPPRWLDALARQAAASSASSALTARNWAAPVRRWVAERNPWLIGVYEGGSNQLLVRPPWRIVETRRLTLARRPERRRMLWVRLAGPHGLRLAVANIHLTSFDSPAARRELLLAAEHAVGWAGDDPLILGGDFNAPHAFDQLRERFSLTPEPRPDTIDHLLVRGLDVLETPDRLPDEERDVAGPRGRVVRLSDHAPTVARFGLYPVFDQAPEPRW